MAVAGQPSLFQQEVENVGSAQAGAGVPGCTKGSSTIVARRPCCLTGSHLRMARWGAGPGLLSDLAVKSPSCAIMYSLRNGLTAVWVSFIQIRSQVGCGVYQEPLNKECKMSQLYGVFWLSWHLSHGSLRVCRWDPEDHTWVMVLVLFVSA